MKKILISLVAVLTMGGTCFAQSSLMATLTHGETVTYFYGDTAFIAAHRAAVHGDEILLSSGYFKASNIEKAVTIKGAGMEEDSISGIPPTVLTGNIYVRIPAVEGKHLTMEGIFHNGVMYAAKDYAIRDALFNKCKLGEITYENYGNWFNAIFIHCRVHYIYLYTAMSATFINSIVQNPAANGEPQYTFKNCVVFFTSSNAYVSNLPKSTFSNCIICDVYSNNYSFPASTYLLNCLCNREALFANSMNGTNRVIGFSNTSPFISIDTTKPYNQFNSYKLTDAVAAKYLGADGTQVGIWGGTNPFAVIPSGPRVKYIAVGNQQADGKLKVTVEVE